MANEIQWRDIETGITLYATIRSKTGAQWNTAGTPNFEAVTAANWADYDIALTEGAGNYFYQGTFPAISGNMVAGWYWVDIFRKDGAFAAIDDTLKGTIVGYWDGTTFGPWDAKLADTAHGGSSASFMFGSGGTILSSTGDALRIETTHDGSSALRLYGNNANSYGLYLDSGGFGDGLYIASTMYVSGQVVFVSPITADAANDIRGVKIGGILANSLPAESVAGRDAAAFGKLFDVATPVLTAEMYGLTAADTGATYVARAPTTGGQTLDTIASAIGGIGSGTGSALNFAVVDDNVLAPLKGITFVGTQTPGTTYANTTAENGSRHIITDSGAATDIDIVYKFTLGSSRRASKCTWKGLVTNGDVIEVYAYDFVAVGWDAIARKVITGTASSSNQTVDINLLEKHTGTGTEAGHVYLRFNAVGESAIVLQTDELLALGQSVSSTTGYSDGAVWVKATGTSGTTPDVNGTADNPCPWADALVVAAAKGLSRFRIINGETVTLGASIANKSLIGENWTLVLAAQVVTAAKIKGATVSGISSGIGAEWEDCHFSGTCTIGGGDFLRCGFGVVTFTMLASSAYGFINCFDDDPDTTTSPVFVFAANAVVGARNWRGAFQVSSMASTNKLTLDGAGRLVITDTSVGGAITVRGFFPPVTGGAGLHTAAEFVAHGGTITQTQRFGADELVDEVWDEVLTGATHNVATSAGRRLRNLGAFSLIEGTLAAGGVAGTSTCTLDAAAAATARLYEQNLLCITAGAGAGQARMIVQYTAGRVVTIERPWDVTTDATSEYSIQSFSGLIITQNGVAQSATASTIVLATSASTTANIYRYNLIYIGAGTGAGQTRLITGYATDRTATIAPDWDVTPDSTSAYKILPVGLSVVQSFTTAALAAINAEADTALSDINLDHLAGTATGIPAIPSGTYIDQIMDDGTADYDRTTDSLQAARDHATTIKTDTGNLVSRITANLFAGITYLAKWLGALAGKTADTTTRAEINATTAGAGYNETTDSLEANRDNIGTAGAGLTSAGGLTVAQAASLAAIEADTNELQTDWHDGGRLDLLLDTAAAGAGGDYTQTVTVKTAGAVAIQGATVYIMDGATIVDKQTTAATGIALPSADAGAYTLKVVKSGYTTNSTTITVTAAAARAVTMTALSFTPPTDEDQVTGWGYVYDESGAAESGATVYIEQVTAGARNIYDSKRRTLTADATGLVSGKVWADGSEYRISRDGVNWSDPFAPEDDGDVALPDSYRLPGLVGTS